jgi:hypothetical protein
VGAAVVEEVPSSAGGERAEEFWAWEEDPTIVSEVSGTAGSIEARRPMERLLKAFLTLENTRLMLGRREGG